MGDERREFRRHLDGAPPCRPTVMLSCFPVELAQLLERLSLRVALFVSVRDHVEDQLGLDD